MEDVKDAISNGDTELLRKLTYSARLLSSKALHFLVFKKVEDFLNTKCISADPSDVRKEGGLLNNEILKTMVNILLDHGANMNFMDRNYSEETIFQYACNHGYVDVVKTIMYHGDNWEYYSPKNRRYCLIYAAFNSGREEIIDIFINLGLDANDINNLDFKLLIMYIKSRNVKIEVIKKIVKLGADVNVICHFTSMTVLNCAFEQNLDEEVIRFLIESGANVNGVNKLGINELQYVISMEEKVAVKFVKLLLEYGAQVNVTPDFFSLYPLHCAIALRRNEIIKLLLDYGADINNIRFEEESVMEGLNEQSKLLIVRRIVLMKEQNIYVSKSSLNAIKTSEKLNALQNECADEIEILRAKQFEDSSVFYIDVLKTKDIRKLAVLAGNVNIAKAVKSDDFKEKFPIYGEMIVENFEKGFSKKKDFELLKRFVNYLALRKSYKLSYLPFTAVCKIYDYLTDAEVNKLRYL